MKARGKLNNRSKRLPPKKSCKKRRKQKISMIIRRKLKRFLLYTVITVFLMATGAVGAFSLMRYRGGKSLKAEIHSIEYQGEEYRYRENIINILCIGVDKWIPLDQLEEERDNIGMADTILLVSLDTDRDEAKVIAIPRDTMTEVQTTMKSGELAEKENLQICYQYAYGRTVDQGNDLMKECVSNLLYGIPIQRYCTLNIESLPILNDAIGGVDVEVKEDVEKWEPRLIYGETMHLDGELALRFVKVRNKDRADGTVLRTKRQKQYALAFVDKAKSAVLKDLSIPFALFQELQEDGYMSTDITMDDISYLLPEVVNVSFPDDAVEVIPGESRMGETGFSEYHRDTDAIKKIVIDTFYEKV